MMRNGESEDRSRPIVPAKSSQVEQINGVLPVDKPMGPTSHDIVARIRRRFGFRKVGHGGTLDPMATGLLIILLGRGTKLSSWFSGSDKTYEGTMRLGVSTDSQDAQGEITQERDFSSVTPEGLESVLCEYRGDIFQTPPMVSAVKVAGVPLYKHARKGREVERKARLIHIYEYTITAFNPPLVDFVVKCTKGTYIRTLCSDVGDKLGCGAHLERLRRTRSGDFDIGAACQVADLMDMDHTALAKKVIPPAAFESGGLLI